MTHEKIKLLTIADLERRKYKKFGLSGHWLNHLGDAEVAGSWLIWGGSGHGKTSYMIQLTKMLCQYEKVFYNTLEEGAKESFKQAVIERGGLKSVASKFTFQKIEYDNFVEWLAQPNRRRPRIIITDSFQYFFRGKGIKQYYDLLEQFPNHLFIFVSHAQGSAPKGKMAVDAMYHSDLKIQVSDFVATVHTSRYYGGGTPHIIWEAGANERSAVLASGTDARYCVSEVKTQDIAYQR